MKRTRIPAEDPEEVRKRDLLEKASSADGDDSAMEYKKTGRMFRWPEMDRGLDAED